MDYNIFMKKSFLNQSVGDFSQTFDKVDYKGFEDIVSQGTHLGMGRLALKICRKSVKSVFDSVDGMPIDQNGSSIIRKDGFVDRDEMFQLIKNSYKGVNNQEISEEKLKKMTLKEAIDLVINFWNKK